MNILVLSQYSTYKELFEKNKEVSLTLRLENIKEVTVQVSGILVDGESIQIEDIAAIREQFPDTPVFYKAYMINSDVIMRNITRLCAAYKVHLISEKLTQSQTVEHVVNTLTNRSAYISNRIISMFGTHSGAGVSTSVMSIAKALSKRIEERVLVLSLNSWDPADYFYLYRGEYLNDLKVDLATKSLTPSRLEAAVDHHDGFYHLAGNRDIKMQRFYKPEEISHLLDVAQSVFDVILIDGGTHFDTAPTIQSYISSNLRFLITNQEEKGYRGYFPLVFQQLIEPAGGKTDDFMLIINRYQPTNTLIDEKKLEEELNMTKFVTIPDLADLGTFSTYQKQLLYDIADHYYTKNIDLIANLIISDAKLTEKAEVLEDRKKPKKLFNLF